MISLEFSMLGPMLSEDQEEVFRQFAQWVVIGERDGRLLVDAIGDAQNVGMAMGLLAEREPVIIGAWAMNGAPIDLHPLNQAAWLAVAPDDEDFTDPENPVAVRPTQYRQINAWAGWGKRVY